MASRRAPPTKPGALTESTADLSLLSPFSPLAISSLAIMTVSVDPRGGNAGSRAEQCNSHRANQIMLIIPLSPYIPGSKEP